MRLFQLALMLVVALLEINVGAQSRTYTKDGLDFVVELPSPEWRAVSRVDVHDHIDFIHTDDSTNGYLRFRKRVVAVDETASDLFRYDQRWELQALPGYVFCGECKPAEFQGQLPGGVFSYEYTSRGKAMAGRIYYLQMDKHTFCILQFTVAREKYEGLLEQMDFIAGSVRIK